MNPLKVLESNSFLLGLLLMVVMLAVFKELVAVVTVTALLGLTAKGVMLVVLDVFLLYIIPVCMAEWAPLVDGEKKC